MASTFALPTQLNLLSQISWELSLPLVSRKTLGALELELLMMP